MNVKFLNPFVGAAYEVLAAEAGLDVARGELGLEKSAYVTDDVTVIIGLVGHVEGTVFYSMNGPASNSRRPATNPVSRRLFGAARSLDCQSAEYSKSS